MKWKPLAVHTPRRSDPVTAELIYIPVYEGELAFTESRMTSPDIFAKARAQGFTGASGSVTERAICLLGLGKRPSDSHGTRQHMHVAGLCVKHALDLHVSRIQILAHASSSERAMVMARNMTIGANLAMPRDTQKTQGVTAPRLSTVELCFYGNDGSDVLDKVLRESPEDIDSIISKATELARAVRLARWWTDLGPNQKVPELFVSMVMAEYERALDDTPVEQCNRFSLNIMEEAELRKRSMNLILAVGGCHHSDHSVPESHRPHLIHFSVLAAKPSLSKKPLILVLKGVTFDSGGLQIKPGDAMQTMKIDMAAASLLALMEYLMTLRGLDRDLHFIVPLVENMTGQGVMRPGDVFESMSGQTVEIGHTDAEGRLILADALHYAQNLGVGSIIIDMATLTGAQMVALGNTAALYANDDELQVQLLSVALDAGESFHPMPLDPGTVPPNESDVADVRNLATGRDGGSITAAFFLRNFVPVGIRWAHIDVAGPVWIDGKPRFGFQNKGPTGFGVLTMARFIETHCVAKG